MSATEPMQLFEDLQEPVLLGRETGAGNQNQARVLLVPIQAGSHFPDMVTVLFGEKSFIISLC